MTMKNKSKGAHKMAKEEPKTSLAVKEAAGQELELSKEVPAYLMKKDGEAARGFENVRKEDLQLPRLKLLQALSPEVADGKGKAGDILNSLSDQNYGNELTFIPIISSYSRVYWESKERDAEILCSSDDGLVPSPRVENPPAESCATCPNSKFQKDKKTGKENPPLCTEFYNFPVLVNGREPAGLAFSRSKINVAKRMMSKAVYAGKGMDLFGLKFKLRTKSERSSKGDYFNFDIVGLGYASEAEYKEAESFYNSLKNKLVTIHQEATAE